MRINDRVAEAARAEPVRGVRPSEVPAGGGEPVRPSAQAGRADRVQISAAGRELAARGSGAPALTPERTAEVRRRILEGAYDSAEVVGRVARAVLERGDL